MGFKESELLQKKMKKALEMNKGFQNYKNEESTKELQFYSKRLKGHSGHFAKDTRG